MRAAGTLDEAAKLADDLFSHGVGSIEDAIRLHQALIDAKLESASSAEARIDILTNALAEARGGLGMLWAWKSR